MQVDDHFSSISKQQSTNTQTFAKPDSQSLSQKQSTYPKPSIFNFLIFCGFIFSLGLFHQLQNERASPIHLNFFQQLIFAGQVHYSRIPVQYWQHRIKMIKAMGLNTLSVYVMWNFHELEKGVFDYQTENKNLTYFLELSIKHKMKVLFRPGPYVCAQWDLGGLPARLLSIQNLKLRSNNTFYIQEVKIYFSSLAPIIRSFIKNPSNPSTSNNPITMLQIQNEYGFYGTDKSYIQSLRQIWKNLQIHCEEYYVDWIENLKSSAWENANVGINNGYLGQNYFLVSAINKNGIVFGGQIYSGWYKKWGQSHDQSSTSLEKFIYMYESLLNNHHSFSVYLVHGGSNFQLTAGANHIYNKQTDYGAVTTSYDYESPITQNGNTTLKYMKFRQLIQKYIDYSLPPIPDPILTFTTTKFNFIKSQELLKTTVSGFQTLKSNNFYVFESTFLKMFHQGAVQYSTNLLPNHIYDVNIQVHDFGLIFLNEVLIKILNRSSLTSQYVSINCGNLNTCEVKIFVQAMGHINFGHQMETDYKGLIKFDLNKQHSDEELIQLQNQITRTSQFKIQWTMKKINLKNQPIINQNQPFECKNAPCVFTAQIDLIDPYDTFIDLSNYQKGYIWVNGHNLGRYWNIGPQYRLYCPGVWLNKGKNKIVILDLLQNQFKQINGKSASSQQYKHDSI